MDGCPISLSTQPPIVETEVVAFRFTPESASGRWRIDIYTDPWAHH
jgi:hypothetical protein